MAKIHASKLFNDYTITPRNLSEYTAFRGITDFTNIGQFNQYEQGYQFISVLGLPAFMKMLGEHGPNHAKIANMNQAFVHKLEYEFRGLSGLPDMNADTMDITDGINSVRMINRVTMDTAVTVSMPYYETSGSLLTKWSELYLTGIKDPKTQAKTYHGLIANGWMDPGFENEVFTLLYYVTDNTFLRLERAVLLCNCQLTKASLSMYDGSRDNISNVDSSIEFNCFPVYGEFVDRIANYMLEDITGTPLRGVGIKAQVGTHETGLDKSIKGSQKTVLDSLSYQYGILNSGADGKYDDRDILLNNIGYDIGRATSDGDKATDRSKKHDDMMKDIDAGAYTHS